MKKGIILSKAFTAGTTVSSLFKMNKTVFAESGNILDIVYMVESNFQRTTILPSEKAFAYKMRLEAMKRQGQRTDLTSSPVATKLGQGRSDAELAEQVGESKDTIRRYIRLTNLVIFLLFPFLTLYPLILPELPEKKDIYYLIN